MIALAPDKLQIVNFEDFIAWYPEESGVSYEFLDF
jgi:hypothetical protein